MTARTVGSWAALALAVLAPTLLGLERPKGLGDVDDVRYWSHPDYTRVVVELSRSAGRPKVEKLAADSRVGRPARLYVDLAGIWVGLRYKEGISVQDGLLQGLRLGQNTRKQSRLVIDLERYDRHRLRILQSPHRVVVDVYGSRDAPETLSWPRPKGVREPSVKRLPVNMRPVRTIVVDPGHGGRDPGASGLGGLREKDVNLELSLILARKLRAEGFEVVLTRTRDRHLDLEQRTVIAESRNADLFISIHANASRRKGTQGIETYYLDENHDRHALDVAARENGVPRSEVDTLQRTLAEFRVQELSNDSRRLAAAVHAELVGGLSKKYRGIEDLGVKQGPFYVLFLSSIPSILVESGFITNPHDAKLLRKGAYLESAATHIARGVLRYRDSGTDYAGVGAGPPAETPR
ncbi:MAG: N-acetylmuramoyl-L-alanine amidase [Myxococcota bacterium]|nr:N-acetylmuramoyl-L-alanine amidase [Myxococcota bacterium]